MPQPVDCSKDVQCRAALPHPLGTPHTFCTVKCPYCKKLVSAQDSHPNPRGGLEKFWLVFCVACDVYTIVPME